MMFRIIASVYGQAGQLAIAVNGGVSRERNTNPDGKFNLCSGRGSLRVPASIEDPYGLRPASSRPPVRTYENMLLSDCSARIVFRFAFRESLDRDCFQGRGRLDVQP